MLFYVLLVLIAIIEGTLGFEIIGEGGQNVTEEIQVALFPHQVAILYHIKGDKGGLLCGGSVLSDSKILTAAHCLDEVVPSDIYVRAGSLNATYGGTIRNVTQFIVHEGYNKDIDYDNDIAIIVLQHPLEFGPKIRPVKRVANETDNQIYNNTGNSIIISGYGASERYCPLSPLRWIEQPICDWTSCYQKYQPNDTVTDNMFCIGNVIEFSFTDGDSGGKSTKN